MDRKDDGTFLTKKDLSYHGIRWSGWSEDRRELENVFFFFSLRGPLPLLFFQEILQIYIVQCCKRTRLAGRENIRGSRGHDLSLSHISSNPIPRVNPGTRLIFHFDHHKLMKLEVWPRLLKRWIALSLSSG